MPNDEGITPLHNAVCAGHHHIVKFLLDFGVNVNAADSDGWSVPFIMPEIIQSRFSLDSHVDDLVAELSLYLPSCLCTGACGNSPC